MAQHPALRILGASPTRPPTPAVPGPPAGTPPGTPTCTTGHPACTAATAPLPPARCPVISSATTAVISASPCCGRAGHGARRRRARGRGPCLAALWGPALPRQFGSIAPGPAPGISLQIPTGFVPSCAMLGGGGDAFPSTGGCSVAWGHVAIQCGGRTHQGGYF